LIIYIGAIAILFLFVVMMINIKLVELTELGQQSGNEEYTKTLPLGAIVGTIFLYELFSVAPSSLSGIRTSLSNIFDLLNIKLSTTSFYSDTQINILSNELQINTGFNNLWESSINTLDQIQSIGEGLYTIYSIWFIIASCILLLAIIGPIVLTYKPNKALHSD